MQFIIDKIIFFVYNNNDTGCRVTVTHQFWELAQAGSTPVIPTISSVQSESENTRFFCL